MLSATGQQQYLLSAQRLLAIKLKTRAYQTHDVTTQLHTLAGVMMPARSAAGATSHSRMVPAQHPCVSIVAAAATPPCSAPVCSAPPAAATATNLKCTQLDCRKLPLMLQHQRQQSP